MSSSNRTVDAIMSSSEETVPSPNATLEQREDYPYMYADGEPIPQHWSPVFIFFAFVTSFVASYAAVRLLDHTLWRSEKEKEHASAIIIKHPQVFAAILLGGGTVWSMHFVGMAAVTLDHIPLCYDWPITFGSLVSAVAFMWAGVAIASRDIFRGPDRVRKLKAIVVQRPDVTLKGRHKQANRTIHLIAGFYAPWNIVGGAMVAATGALIMHYTGMTAIRGAFHKTWSVGFVAGSVVLGIVVCCAGFWILFRLLLWKVEQFWLRPVSAAVIALAVCTLHFFGMLSVTYTYDSSLAGTCHSGEATLNPDIWTTHQVLALAVGLTVPSLALLVENMISRELFHAYSKLKNPALTVEYLLEAASRSRDSTLRRASINIKNARQTGGGVAGGRGDGGGRVNGRGSGGGGSFDLKRSSSFDDINSLACQQAASMLSRASAGSGRRLSAMSSTVRRGSTASSIGGRRGSCQICGCICHEPDVAPPPPVYRTDSAKRIGFTSAVAPDEEEGGGSTGMRRSFTSGMMTFDADEQGAGEKATKRGSNASLPPSFQSSSYATKGGNKEEPSHDSVAGGSSGGGEKNQQVPVHTRPPEAARRVSFHDADGAIFSLEEGRFITPGQQNDRIMGKQHSNEY